MKIIEKVNLRFRCTEDINSMKDCSSGKYCSTCNKTVIDFRKSSISELRNELIGKFEVCGIFSNEQICSAPNISSSQSNHFKRYVVGILVSLGITFFNRESFAQSAKQDSCKTICEKNEDEKAFFGGISEVLPSYKKVGNVTLTKFIKNNLNYPKDGEKGKVLISFIIDNLGKVTKPKIIESLNEIADDEALRIIRLLEFYPGIQNGKPKSYADEIMVLFNIEN